MRSFLGHCTKVRKYRDKEIKRVALSVWASDVSVLCCQLVSVEIDMKKSWTLLFISVDEKKKEKNQAYLEEKYDCFNFTAMKQDSSVVCRNPQKTSA